MAEMLRQTQFICSECTFDLEAAVQLASRGNGEDMLEPWRTLMSCHTVLSGNSSGIPLRPSCLAPAWKRMVLSDPSSNIASLHGLISIPENDVCGIKQYLPLL